MAAQGVPSAETVQAVTEWVRQQCALLRDVAPVEDGFQERLRASSAISVSRGMEQTADSACRSLLYELSREKVSDVAVRTFWQALMGVALAAGDWHKAPENVRDAIGAFLDKQS
ncbi:hypothetical protein ABT160_37700 [Streptomyces sp. NPDC001941]|uniref:hypothetical protein n=1 Tax=Streptomyces sp. NPDC001941 TaxID=3154659 RepID=UPI00332E0E4D